MSFEPHRNDLARQLEDALRRIETLRGYVKASGVRLDGYASQHERIMDMCANVVGRDLPIEERVRAVCELAKART